MAFIQRNIIRTITGLLSNHGTVLVEGPPRSGRSTIARQLAASSPAGAVTLDARGREGRAVLAAPLTQSAARPVILDNASADDAVRLASGLSRRASGDQDRQARFVLVGGPFKVAGGELASAETAGADEAALVHAGPLSLFEAGPASMRALWFRGGYPEAYGAASNEDAMLWLEGYAADLAHGALAAWGMPRSPALVTGLLEAAALANGRAFNENAAARDLGISRPTVGRYLTILHRAGILSSVPALPPSFLEPPLGGRAEGAPRAVKAPVQYVRDSGLLHCLLGVRTPDDLALKPRAAAASWAGFVATQAIEAAPAGTGLFHYASVDGAALDLVVVRDGVSVLVAAARRHRPASLERSISYAARTIGGARLGRLVVAPDGAERDLPGGFTVTGLGSFLERLASA